VWDSKTASASGHFNGAHPCGTWISSRRTFLRDITSMENPLKAVAQPSKRDFYVSIACAAASRYVPFLSGQWKPGRAGRASGIHQRSPFRSNPWPTAAKWRSPATSLIDFTPVLSRTGKQKRTAPKFNLGAVYTPPTVSKMEGRSARSPRGTDPAVRTWRGRLSTARKTAIGGGAPPSPLSLCMQRVPRASRHAARKEISDLT